MRTILMRSLTVLLVLAWGTLADAADVVSIWGGARGTIVLKSDGTVWTWGANFAGKLGVGLDAVSLVRTNVPIEVHGPGNVSYLNSITNIMGGEVHSIAVKSDGTVWGWGQNEFGQLGDGTTNDESAPVQVGLGCVPPLGSVTKLGGRTYWNLAVKTDGTVWAWGMNQGGQLGNGTTISTLDPNQNTTPVQLTNSRAGGVINNPIQVSCGYTYGVALATNGTVWTWGTGSHGELGNGTTGLSYTPVQVVGLTNITSISSGWKHTLARRADGTVWGWGQNTHGELGDGTALNRSSPVQALNLTNIISVSGGDYHSSALSADGYVWKWGQNDVGELGNGTTNALTVANPVSAPILVDKFGAGFSNIVMTAARDYHNLAVKADGSVWMWGANDQGQCGDGTTNDDWQPTPVVGLGARVGRILNWQPGGDNLTLKWDTATGEYFAIEYTTNLAAGFTSVIQSNLLSTPPANTVTLTNGPGYYRLKF
jgi:alpha-tubulin suppressor-like RCC1 family protein